MDKQIFIINKKKYIMHICNNIIKNEPHHHCIERKKSFLFVERSLKNCLCFNQIIFVYINTNRRVFCLKIQIFSK